MIRDLLTKDDRERLVQMFQQVSGLSKKPQPLRLSQEPKCEVAYGLLVYEQRSRAADLKMENAWQDTLLGEALYVNDQQLKAFVTSSKPDEQFPWRVEELAGLRNMVEWYKKGLGRQLQLDHELENSLKRKINHDLENMRYEVAQARQHRPDSSDRIVHEMEPIFIIALRALIEQLILKQSMSQNDVIQ